MTIEAIFAVLGTVIVMVSTVFVLIS